MKASDIPAKIQLPFGASAGGSYIRTVPVASQMGVTAGAWSYTDGSVPLNFEEVSLGGVPPDGRDFNGLLNVVSAHNRWAISGGPVPWDGTFSTAIGGYPMGAVVQSVSTFGKMWVSTADDNTTDPDTGGANWMSFVDWLGITAAYTAAISAAIGSSLSGAAKAWVRYNGITKTILSSFNVASVTYNGVGDYTVNFTTAFGSANYAALCTGILISGVTYIVSPSVYTAGSVRILVEGNGIYSDQSISVACFGS